MMAIQYRDAESEILLECVSGGGLPQIGDEVRIGLHLFRVLYRWKGGPGAQVAYVTRLVPGALAA